ncbi:Ig-like domain-containing protein [Rhodococcus sp. UNC363MFTsu5.1]|uniref:Ig-like domain-containing protein n=1 Tax=Rhodococcus sp. UNC363MFTsu5.1 TaxID=1449069 RepID=UPI0004878F5B|nr:Ig-like domain-containing protein [Rhodococcus sp. UNC363MFTsu5.1]
MTSPTPLRRGAAALAAAGLTAGALLLATPASAAPTTTGFDAACWGKFKSLLDNTHKSISTGVTVEAPASVVTGETFTYRLQPDTMTLARNGENLRIRSSVSRIKFDYEIPAGAQFVSATVVPGTGVNLAGSAPTVTRVAENGSPSATGTILRLSGNNETVGNGPAANDGAEGGIVVNAGSGDTSYRLPAIEVTAVAGPAGSVVTPKLRTTGAAANYKADENFFTSLVREKDPVFSVSYWSATRCVPKNGTDPGSGVPLNAGAGPLATINVTAPPDATTTTAVAAPATANTGAAVDLTATVSPAPAGGTVQFKDGDDNIGGPIALSGATATLSHTFTAAGAHAITAVYSGAPGFAPSTSAPRSVEVSVATVDTTTVLTTPTHAKTGVSVGLAATVAPAPNGGTVQFLDGGAPIGAPVTVAGGVATLAHTFDSAGSHSITASFSGAPGSAPSTAAAKTITVSVPAPNETATSTTLDAPTPATQNQAVTLTATVAPSQAGGTVQFFDGVTAIGAPMPVANGTATLSHAFGTVGAHGITAVYSGAAGFLGSTSDAHVVNVTAVGTPGGGSGSAGSIFGS